MTKVVVLAAGRGTRMRREVAGLQLQAEQARRAAQGLKGLIPIHGRPYLDYVISAAADAGLHEVCLVVRPGNDPIRAHYETHGTQRVRLTFAVQSEPLGSAHAVLAAEAFVAGEPFLVLNSDNYYPPCTLRAMRQLEGCGLAGFRRRVLVSEAGIPEDRLAAYALVTVHADGYLSDIIEKPDAATLRSMGDASWVSMTCWRFGPSILEASRSISISSRGEYELPDAVLHAVRHLGERFRVVPSEEAVLDLSGREDIPVVTARLRGRTVHL